MASIKCVHHVCRRSLRKGCANQQRYTSKQAKETDRKIFGGKQCKFHSLASPAFQRLAIVDSRWQEGHQKPQRPDQCESEELWELVPGSTRGLKWEKTDSDRTRALGRHSEPTLHGSSPGPLDPAVLTWCHL